MTHSIHPAAANGFSKAAKLYQEVRPSYPAALSEYLQTVFQQSSAQLILDVGSGTGKFLPTLFPLNTQIIAIDPVAEMLNELKFLYPYIQTIQAPSHAVPIQDSSVSAIFCAQSFHWFSNTETLNEFSRLLQENGQVFLIWNQRDVRVDWVHKIAELLLPYEGDTPRYHSNQWQNVWQNQSNFTLLEQPIFDFSHHGTVHEVVCQRLLSTSFIAAMPLHQQQKIAEQFADIVLHMTGKTLNDSIDFPYRCHVYRYVYKENTA